MCSSDLRSYDVVVLGASGFTGRLAVQYLNERYSSLNYAVTARSTTKLEQLKQMISGSPNAVATLCDVTDPLSLDSVVRSASCVLNFAGSPFIDKALPVVEACAKHGTHYVDITGEVPLHRASYDRYHKAAAESGAIILHQCGFDSVPADLCAYLAVKAMRERHDCQCSEVRLIMADSKGGVSGGTLASGAHLIANRDLPGMAEVKARGAYPLDPADGTGGPDTSFDGRNGALVSYDVLARTWTMPFIMSGVNVPLVRKSAALLGYGAQDGCRISEAAACKSRLEGIRNLFAIGIGGFFFVLPPTRWLLLKLGIIPSPGEGPNEHTRETGHFHEYAIAVGAKEGAPVVKAHMRSGDAGDPGYKATARMACEAALTLALQRSDCHKQGGVLTPAVALGDAYIKRLQVSGMELNVDS